MTGVVERNLSHLQILKGIKTKIRYCPNIFLMVFRDKMMDYKGELKLVL